MIYRALGILLVLYFVGLIAGLHRSRRISRPVFLLYETVLAAIALAFLFPDRTNVLARAVGITRGADFGVYTLSLFLLILTFHLIRSFRQEQVNFQRLVRELALRDARDILDERGTGERG